MNLQHSGSMFVVLIGDLVRSRRLTGYQRGRTQTRLEKTLHKINRDHQDRICIRLQFTAGDEFQGVLRTADRLFSIINLIREAISPVPVRFGIGVGKITTPLSSHPQAMDGPAFHRARDALKRAQEFLEQTYLSSGQYERDEAVNAWLDVLSFIRAAWSIRAREVIRLYEEFGKLEPTAKKLNISIQAVSKHLRVTGYKAYARGEEVMTKLLRAYGQPQPKMVETE